MRTLGLAGTIGLRYWITGNQQDLEAFKKLVIGTKKQSGDQLPIGWLDYSAPGYTVARNLLYHSPAFSDEERQEFTDYLYAMAYRERDAYYVYKCADMPLDEIDFDGSGIPKCYVGGGGTDIACYDLKKKELKWTFDKMPVHPSDAAILDIDADGKPEIVASGCDGFLYVLKTIDVGNKPIRHLAVLGRSSGNKVVMAADQEGTYAESSVE